jgi:hypothetical protein
MSTRRIAGPRREVKATRDPPSAPWRRARRDDTPTRVYYRPSAIPSPPREPPAAAVSATRSLPPLDYEEASLRRASHVLELTRPDKRRQARYLRWFAVGLTLGVLAAALWQGGATALCRTMRSWSADAIRSLERQPRAPATATAALQASLIGPDESLVRPSGGVDAAGSRVPANACGNPLAPLAAEGAAPVTPHAAFAPAAETRTVSIDDLPAAR